MQQFKDKFENLDVSSGLSVGLVRSFTLVISLFALASIVFSGELVPYVPNGTGMFFVGTAILSLFLAVFGKFPAPVATIPIPVALVMVMIADAIELEGQAFYLTYVLSIVGCTLLTGILFLLIGVFKFANFFRFVPFTVAAGVLAGSGILILLMALRLAGISWDSESWESLLAPIVYWWKWSLSIALGLILLVASKIWKRFWVVPVLFVAFCALFHLGMWLLDISIEKATASGLFLNVDWSGALWPAYTIDDVGSVSWAVVAQQMINGTVLFLVLLVLTVVSFAQLERGSPLEFDWNREFKLHGVANLFSGAGGGIPGAMVASDTLPNIALRAITPVTSLVIAVVLVLFVLFGSNLLRLIPLAATSGFLIFIAIPLITDWLITSRKRLHVSEYCMLVLICLAIVFVGFLEAIALGLVLSLVLFAVRLSQVDLIETNYTISDRRSRQLRSIPEESILSVYGTRAQIYRLHGYIFFGSAYSFARRLKQDLTRDHKPVCVIVDFSAVTGFDLSAVDSLRGYVQSANSEKVKTILSSTSTRLKQEIQRDFPPELFESVEWMDSEEAALIRAEELLMNYYDDEVASDPYVRDLVRRSTSSEITEYLNRQVAFEELVDALSVSCKSIEYKHQEEIAEAHELQDGMQLLVAGRASVQSDDDDILHQCQPGAVIEPGSAIEKGTAMFSTISEGDSRTILVTPEDLARLETEDRSLARELYRYVVSTTSAASSVF